MSYLSPPIKRLRISFLMTLIIISFFSSCSEDKDPAAQLPPVISTYAPEAAFVNESIIITGENFGTSISDVEVFFYEDAPATVTAVTNTSITVTIPDNAYVGNVRVKVKNLEAEGGEFTVMTICSVYIGEWYSPIPCPRVKADGPR
jgi:IPT/TIG domain